MKNQVKELYEKVIKNDYCIGCGACATVKNSPFKIKMNEFGNIVAYNAGNIEQSEAEVLEVCPFSGKSKNEDEISDIYFKDALHKDRRIGKYMANFAGYVKTGEFRKKGSSGGIGKWLGYTLLDENKIDYFIQVLPNQSNDPSQPLFSYQVNSDKNKVLLGSKSSYYPVSLENILEIVKRDQGRYAITGVPCFIKTLRLLSLKDPILNERIKYTIGIVCGGMKSANQSKIISWQLGVKPENLTAIDFRRKYADKPASNKIYEVWSSLDKKERYKDAGDILGTDWSGYFTPKACEYCDDVVSETADISIGDAWLPKYINDAKGTNVIIVRNKELLDLLSKHKEEGTLFLDEISADDVATSQAGGLRQRREGLSYRISKKEKKNEWYPPKRVRANEFKITWKRKRIYDYREMIAKKSHTLALKALQNNNLTVFIKGMKPLHQEYFASYKRGKFIWGYKMLIRVALTIKEKLS